MRSLIIASIDVVIHVAELGFALVCIWNIVKSSLRGFVYFSGKQAFRSKDPLGYWLVVLSWAGIAAFLLYLVTDAVISAYF